MDVTRPTHARRKFDEKKCHPSQRNYQLAHLLMLAHGRDERMVSWSEIVPLRRVYECDGASEKESKKASERNQGNTANTKRDTRHAPGPKTIDPRPESAYTTVAISINPKTNSDRRIVSMPLIRIGPVWIDEWKDGRTYVDHRDGGSHYCCAVRRS